MNKTLIVAALVGAVAAGSNNANSNSKKNKITVVVEEPIVPAGPCDAFAGGEFENCINIALLESLINDAAITGPCASIESDFTSYVNCTSINTTIIETNDATVTNQCATYTDYPEFDTCVDLILNPPAPAGPCSDYWQTASYDSCQSIEEVKLTLDPAVASQCDYIKTDYPAFYSCVDLILNPPAPAGPCSDYWQTASYNSCQSIEQVKLTLDPAVASQCDYIKTDISAFSSCVDLILNPPAPAGPCSDYWQTASYNSCESIEQAKLTLDPAVSSQCDYIKTNFQAFSSCVDLILNSPVYFPEDETVVKFDDSFGNKTSQAPISPYCPQYWGEEYTNCTLNQEIIRLINDASITDDCIALVNTSDLFEGCIA